MRIAKYALISHAGIIVTTAVLISLGIYHAEPVLHVAALWLFVFFLVSSLLLAGRGYRRITTRIGTAGERLSELKYLQERRYEQLSGRLDRLSALVDSLDSSDNTHQANLIHSMNRAESGRNLAELEDINARVQRAERRILGRLENELFANALRDEQIDIFLSELGPESSIKWTHTESD